MAPASPATATPRAPAKRAPAKRAPAAKGGSKAAPAKTSTRSQRNSRAIASARASQRAAAAPATRTAPARRRSGPAAKPKPAQQPARQRQAAPSPVARVLSGRGMPLIDRLLRGRGWVVIVGALLAGIVFLNVSVLELNRGIAQTDASAAGLERTNSALRERVAKLDSGERIQQLAARKGFVMPQPGDVTFVRPRPHVDAKLAAQRITPPAPTTATAAPTTTATAPTTATTTATAPVTDPTTQPVQQPVAAPAVP
jgi:cell division protein FtsL